MDKTNAEYCMTFGMLVRQKRKQKKMNQHEMAVVMGVSRNYYSLIEQDKAHNISAKIFIRLIHVLALPLEYSCDVYCGIALGTSTVGRSARMNDGL